MDINIKKLNENAVIPTYAKFGDAGMDLTCISASHCKRYIEYDTGLSVEIPEGYVGLLFPRSSVSKKDLLLCNSIGVIDSGYRGPLKVRFKLVEFAQEVYKVGDRVAQIVIMPFPSISFKEVEELSETVRGAGGFGHTGN